MGLGDGGVEDSAPFLCTEGLSLEEGGLGLGPSQVLLGCLAVVGPSGGWLPKWVWCPDDFSHIELTQSRVFPDPEFTPGLRARAVLGLAQGPQIQMPSEAGLGSLW